MSFPRFFYPRKSGSDVVMDVSRAASLHASIFKFTLSIGSSLIEHVLSLACPDGPCL